MKEIGSSFELINTNGSDTRFFLSGRTALEFIIRDILAQGSVGTVFMPSYCCHSMLEPFVRHGLSVKFYDVFFEDNTLRAALPNPKSEDIFFYIKYFGFSAQSMGDPTKIKESGARIIADTTHSFLCEPAPDFADYSFTSYRKWSGFSGISSATKKTDSFVIKQKTKTFEEYETLFKDAQRKKASYLLSAEEKTKDFLPLFSQAEELLDKDYADYQPIPESLSALINLDKEEITKKRRENAKILLSELEDLPQITPMLQITSKQDVPLFVPILTDSSVRDALRKFLIENQIYCPVHWPVSDMHQGISEKGLELYRSQLSLVCDQRYDGQDMKRIARCIKKFFEV